MTTAHLVGLIATVTIALVAVVAWYAMYHDLFRETRETPASEPCSCQGCVERARENVWDAEADLVTAKAELVALLGRAGYVPTNFSTPAAKGFNRDRRSSGPLWEVPGPTRVQ
jgi:hypothetical protein